MHKFLRTVGFSMYQKKRVIDKLIQGLAEDRDKMRILQLDSEESLCELRVETAPGMGIAIVGGLDERDRFDVEYYYPYFVSHERSSIADCSIQRHTEKETYAGLLDDCLLYTSSCWLTYTNSNTHEIIRANLDRSPLFSGAIEGTGPRYCPSIEDKVVKFPDKDRHQVFVEPEGLYTNEMYLGGMSSSLPEDVQYAMYRTVPGLEQVKIVRNAYAIAVSYTHLHVLLLNKEGYRPIFLSIARA